MFLYLAGLALIMDSPNFAGLCLMLHPFVEYIRKKLTLNI